MKVILNVADNFKPNDLDMLVYNEKSKLWETKNFQVICKEQNLKIEELDKKLKLLQDAFRDIDARFNDVLDIVKEQVEND